VKILFDTNVPAPFRRFLRGHDVVRAIASGWGSFDDRMLLAAAEDHGFEAVVTCGWNLPKQQDFTGRNIAWVVLSTNRWSVLRKAAPRLAIEIDFAQRGQITRIDVAAL
jgi:ABC-type taurine transport system substrate-binding protein